MKFLVWIVIGLMASFITQAQVVDLANATMTDTDGANDGISANAGDLAFIAVGGVVADVDADETDANEDDFIVHLFDATANVNGDDGAAGATAIDAADDASDFSTTYNVDVGQTFTIDLVVANESASSDAFTLSTASFATSTADSTQAVSGFMTASGGAPSGWTIRFLNQLGAEITSTPPIPGGSVYAFQAEVTVSSDGGQALSGTDYYLAFAVNSVSNCAAAPFTDPTTGVADVKVDLVQINPFCSVSIIPNGSEQVELGSTEDFEHTLSNGGNSDKTFDLRTYVATDDNGVDDDSWTSTIFVDTDGDDLPDTALGATTTGICFYNAVSAQMCTLSAVVPAASGIASITLAPGEQIFLWNRFFAPLTAADGAIQTSSVEADVTDADATACAADPIIATDTATGIIIGDPQIDIVKSATRQCGADVLTQIDGDFQYSLLVTNSGAVAPAERPILLNSTTVTTDGVLIIDTLDYRIQLISGQSLNPTPAQFVVQRTADVGMDRWISYSSWNGTDALTSVGLFAAANDLEMGEGFNITFGVRIDPNVVPADDSSAAAGNIINTASVDLDGNGSAEFTSNQACNELDVLEPNVILSSDQNTTAMPGQTVELFHSLENTGELDDTYDMQVSNVAGIDDGDFESLSVFYAADLDGLFDDVLTTTPTLMPGDQLSIKVEAVVPAGAVSAESYQLNLVATSNHGNFGMGLSAANTDEVIIIRPAVLDLTLTNTRGCGVDILTAFDGDFSYTMNVTNVGDLPPQERSISVDGVAVDAVLLESLLDDRVEVETGQTIIPTPAGAQFVLQRSADVVGDLWITYGTWNGTDEIAAAGLLIDADDLEAIEMATVTFGLHIAPDVVAADAGADIFTTATVDLDGDNTTEFSSNQVCNELSTTVYVDLNATGADNGSSWANAFDTIQEGVDASVENGLILVAEGTYMITDEIAINQPLTIRGGFPTSGGMQDIDNHPTIIDAFESITANRQRVMQATHVTGSLNLEGLTLQNGLNASDGEGGAIRTTGDLILHQVIIRDNNVSNAVGNAFGGAIYTQTGRIMVTNSQIIDNAVFASSFAAGNIYSESGDVTLVESMLSGNEVIAADNFAFGGGVSTTTGNITLVNSEVSNNHSMSESFAAEGGGLMSNDGAIYVVNSLIYANQASTDPLSTFDASGGGMRNNNGSVHLINSAVVNNTALSFFSGSGGGVVATDVNMHNSLLWDNRLSIDGGMNFVPSEFSANVLTTTNSLIKGVDLTADNGLDASAPGFDPLFADAMNGDFRLTLGSPLIDAGDFNLLPADEFDVDGDGDVTERIPLDLTGTVRELGANVEMGPFEFQTEYVLGGQLTGLLSGNTITLQNIGNDDVVSLTENGAFVFGQSVMVGGGYEVTVLAQPNDPIQPCSVTNPAGTIVDRDITDVLVSCEMGDDVIFKNGFE